MPQDQKSLLIKIDKKGTLLQGVEYQNPDFKPIEIDFPLGVNNFTDKDSQSGDLILRRKILCIYQNRDKAQKQKKR